MLEKEGISWGRFGQPFFYGDDVPTIDRIAQLKPDDIVTHSMGFGKEHRQWVEGEEGFVSPPFRATVQMMEKENR